MPTNGFYNVNEVYTEKYYQLPQWLFTNEKYKDLSNNARIAYALLKDRNRYSIKNRWFDADGNIYFIFTNKELASMLNISERTVPTVKKELIKHKLLYIKKMGFNSKLRQNLPSRLYLLKPILSAEEVYQQMFPGQNEASALQPNGSANIAFPKNEASALQPSGSANIAFPKNEASALQPSGSANISVNLNHSLDTNKIHEDTHLDFSSKEYSIKEINEQNKDLVKHAKEYYTQTDTNDKVILNSKALNLLAMWVRTPQELNRVVRIILNARNSVLTQLDKKGVKNAEYILRIDGNQQQDPEELKALKELGIETDKLQNEITNTLRRVLNAMRRMSDNRTDFNTENYLFGAFKRMFADYAEKVIEKREKLQSEWN
ncbi:replication initiator protein A [Lactobacillus kefiranofaciens]|uniref:replication initiator protein A n=2 Tax=Bacteria TaxID=2 RepID=UPI0021C26CFC|nr:replication initiator protein A [Lactobacillus kefiranofaciens]MCP9331541.1 replication initiator protein A [Lactobacillus kefiranofaciens]